MRLLSLVVVPLAAATACAQSHARMPVGLPVVPPPGGSFAHAAQPLWPTDHARPAAAPASPVMPEPPSSEVMGPQTAEEAALTEAEQRAHVFRGSRVEGKQLKKIVDAVAKLPWIESLDDACGEAAATGKPVLVVQALGDIDGFA